MMKRIATIIIFTLLSAFSYAGAADNSLNSLFPSVAELPGGSDHWIHSVLPVEEKNGCKLYSATYAYFANSAKPLFDIPRKNIYSVNVRFHECISAPEAAKLYDTFSKVGDADRKRLVSVGEKGVLYVVPSEKNQLMGDYYLTSLMRNVVMQVHSDDGFVLMDMSDMIAKRLSARLGLGHSLDNGVTLTVSKDNYRYKQEFVTFSGEDIVKVEITGTVFDQENKRLEGAKISVLETGESTLTGKDGNFKITLSVSGKGKAVSLFRAVELEYTGYAHALDDGYYRADIRYDTQGSISQDIWRLNIARDGSITGTTFNIADEKKLPITGKITDNNIMIMRDCGSSFIGQCRQTFTAAINKDSGVYVGSWAGTGGGGRWMFYTAASAPKSVKLSMAEADFKVSPEKSADQIIAAGKKPQYINITPLVKNHGDFYVDSANLLIQVKGLPQAVTNDKEKSNAPIKNIFLYSVGADGSMQRVSTSAPVTLDGNTSQLAIDITNIYKSANANEYRLGFAVDDKDEVKAELSLHAEIRIASPAPKIVSGGTLRAEHDPNSKTDAVSAVKAPKSDGQADIALILDISAYGGTLRRIDISSLGDKRSWSSDMGNFYPGVGVVSNGLVVNKTDGSLEYPLTKMDETLMLFISKGSADMAKITGFEITVYVDNDNFTIPVAVSK